ncbi:MAG: 30S ribosome-binding factor RbfA [Desulfobacterales bacterium]|jgi:ribosome-binding factor A|nr:30S ribosome-binding factor RbfA [Desulfobacterales bacterium]
MKPFARSDRVGCQIQKILSDILLKRVKDPRLKSASITGVKMSRDLRIARVYFITSDNQNTVDKTIDGFKSALGYVKYKLASELGLRYMPELRFFYDESFEYGIHIDTILSRIHDEDRQDRDNAPSSTNSEDN